jgi:NADH-quinone oxidoreductase subunit J
MPLLADSVLNLPDIPGDWVVGALFAAFALLSIAGALAVVIAKDPFRSALALIINFAGLGALFLLLDASFVAISQIIVYASAVVVLFLFVIAYLGDRREIMTMNLRAAAMGPAGLVVAIGMFVVLTVGVVRANIAAFPRVRGVTTDVLPEFGFGSPQAIGQVFLTKYLLEFEAISIVLLVAAIGGIVLGLTGRTRHRKLQTELGVTSADEHKRRFRRRLDAPTTPGTAVDEHHALHGQGSGGGLDTHAEIVPIGGKAPHVNNGSSGGSK